MDKFNKQIQDKIKTWNNSILADINHDKQLRYILKYHKQIYNFIVKNYSNLNTKKSHISALAVIFRTLLGIKSRLYKRYSLISTELNKIVEDNYKDQIFPANRDIISLKEIEKRRDEIGLLFDADKKNKKLNLQHLLLSLYTYQPPLRQDYKNMIVVQNKIPNKNDNFILHKDNKYFVVIQNDKFHVVMVL